MPKVSGSFSGSARMQSLVSVPDKPNHQISLGEIAGTQKSSDANWNDSAINYWATTDTVDGKGTQSGYFVNDHGGGNRDWGTFEGKVTTNGNRFTIRGSWKFTGGSGEFRGLTGSGTFVTEATPTGADATWRGAYELAAKKRAARS